MSAGRVRHDEVERRVDEALRRVGKRVVVGTPLGAGKPIAILDELVRRAREDAALDLRILTALSPVVPRWSGELERRLVEPLARRVFGEGAEPDYVRLLLAGELPPNVRVSEFYFAPGAMLDSPAAQQQYQCSDYVHVVRDALDAGVNVFCQLVAREGALLSYGSNPDVSVDLVPALHARRARGEPVALLAQVHREMPFMPGDAAVAPDAFDAVIDDARLDVPLFAPPKVAVGTADYAIGCLASALVRDGGTLQLGIGSLGDAVTRMLLLRQRGDGAYRALVDALAPDRAPVERMGGTAPFERGLYAATEMLADGFLHLRAAGVLRRRVYDHAGLQRLLDEGRIGEDVSVRTLEALVAAGVLPARLGAEDVLWLRRVGVLRPEVAWEDGALRAGGRRLDPDLADRASADAIARHALGTRLCGGALAHAAFFLGPRDFYCALRELAPEERAEIRMTAVSWVNRLHGDEELKRSQRRHARFLNTAMMATLLGAAVSDGLEDGRVVSGVGGQADFVAMAHELAEGRSVLMLRSTRASRGRTSSNLRWSYGHTTIPRHLRDVVVTEYGIADLRGRTDAEVVAALVCVADSRFQEGLVREARRAGKLPRSWRVPDRFRANLPARLERALAPGRRDGTLPDFPFGSEITALEHALARALRALGDRPWHRRLPRAGGLRKILSPPAAARPFLERMGLERPRTIRERLMQKALLHALALQDAI